MSKEEQDSAQQVVAGVPDATLEDVKRKALAVIASKLTPDMGHEDCETMLALANMLHTLGLHQWAASE